MKSLHSVQVFILLVLLIVQACTPGKYVGNYKPIRWNGFGKDKRIPFKKDQLIVFYKDRPTPEHTKQIRQAIADQGVTVTAIQQCSSCDVYMELWKGPNIHTVIHTDGVKAGSGGGGSRPVGEDTLARYSLNYINSLPVDMTPALSDSITPNYKPDKKLDLGGETRTDTITIAVLDTGIDTANFVTARMLWKNPFDKGDGSDPDRNCLVNDVNGWNFIANDPNINDDNPTRHGTLVSSYIIHEFMSTSKNYVQLMSLKTHDNHGFGDLFSSICAIHYAIDKGANIINASWGFYYYDDRPHPYLDSLLTKTLKEKGILFVTAAGNKIPEEDIVIREVYLDSFGITLPDAALRNLEIHNFYPACFSATDNSVLTVTTTNGLAVSPTQNYSNQYVDLGIRADLVQPTHMKFLEPFTNIPQYISGSSFAAAIATGKIGAWLPKAGYRPGIIKDDVFNELKRLITAGSIPNILFHSTALGSGKLIRNGQFSKRK